uniref:Uncharacterized protein n=1 Tax=Anguilla anguilla TaxID=7936 RepID=A0A0E9UPY9_ANGAN
MLWNFLSLFIIIIK